MLEQRGVAAAFEQLRRHAEECFASGDYAAADAAYEELHRQGGLVQADVGRWLGALRSLGVGRTQPSLRELVETFPDDQDILEFVAAELWQRAESRAEQTGVAEDDELARQAWSAALRMAGPVPETDADGVRLISLLDRFFQAGRRQRTPVGSYLEFEQALYRFAAAGPESTLRAADLLAAESPMLALELVAGLEQTAASLLVRAVASAELDWAPSRCRLRRRRESERTRGRVRRQPCRSAQPHDCRSTVSDARKCGRNVYTEIHKRGCTDGDPEGGYSGVPGGVG